jgi:hypothetical protein
MTTETARKLNDLKYYRTRYEVIATDGTHTVRLGFSGRKTKRALLDFAQANGSDLIEKFNPTDDDTARYTRGVWDFGTFRVLFSGETERGCVIAGTH